MSSIGRLYVYAEGGAWHSNLTKIQLFYLVSYFNLGALDFCFGGQAVSNRWACKGVVGLNCSDFLIYVGTCVICHEQYADQPSNKVSKTGWDVASQPCIFTSQPRIIVVSVKKNAVPDVCATYMTINGWNNHCTKLRKCIKRHKYFCLLSALSRVVEQSVGTTALLLTNSHIAEACMLFRFATYNTATVYQLNTLAFRLWRCLTNTRYFKLEDIVKITSKYERNTRVKIRYCR